MARPQRRTIGTVSTVGIATIAVVVGLAMAASSPGETPSAVGAPGDRDGDTIADSVECPAPLSHSLVNGSFEQPIIGVGQFVLLDQIDIDGWSTTASDGLIEIWHARRGVNAADGSQLAEVNGTRPATLFADIATEPGDTLEWRVLHRGRDGNDTLTIAVGNESAPPTPLRTVTSGPDEWTEYSGRYNVPDGQLTTRLSLISGATAGRNNAGNFVDGVVLRPVERDTDLDGTSDCDDGDSDNDGLLDRVEVGPDPGNPLDSDGDGTPDYRQAANAPTITVTDDEAAGIDGEFITLEVGANDSAPIGARLVFDVIEPATSAITRLGPDGMLELMLDPNTDGADSMRYEACLAHDASVCATATVAITIEGRNDAPVAVDDIIDDGVADGSAFGWQILENDTDLDGQLDVASLRIVELPSVGSAEIDGDELVYTTPTELPSTTIELTYEVCDDGVPARCDQATVFIDLTELPPDEL